jgi:hypothetical protein
VQGGTTLFGGEAGVRPQMRIADTEGLRKATVKLAHRARDILSG